MQRRELLKKMALSTAAVVALPSWANAWSGAKIQASGLFSVAESSTLTSIAGTFIPEGKDLGAVGVEVDKYLDRLIADCYTPEDIARVKSGMNLLEKTAKTTYSKNFSDCNQGQRESLLLGFSEPSNEEKKWFYDTLRRETIRGYTTSEYVMVNHYNYVMAPAHFKGCVDVAA